MIAGVPLTLGGAEYVAAPASMRTVRAWMTCQKATEVGSVERFDGMLAFILGSLQRNYPDLTIDFVLDHVDSQTLPEVMRAVQGVSGLKAATPAENGPGDKAPGEAEVPSTGTSSM